MAKFGGRSVLALLLAVSTALLSVGVESGEEELEEAEAEEALEGIAGPAGADDWFAAQRVFPFGSLDVGEMQDRARVAAANLQAAPGIQAAWQPLGPANIGGRITDLVAHPTQANTVFAGAATGGVWRSTDAGTTFTSVWNPSLSPSIGALAITSTGTLYAGTGEGNPGGGSVTFPGEGVFRSTDNGASWQSLGLSGTDRIGRIAVDPGNANRLFVAAAGNLFVPGGQRGLYRTTDGGTTWQLVLAGANGTTGAIDVAVAPNNPNRIYAAMWDHKRQPNGRVYGGVGSGVYRSTDGGTTWTRLAGGLPAAGTNLGRMGLAVARSNPNRLYAIAADTSGDFAGFWTSTNGGDTWTRLTNTSAVSAAQSTFGWWFGRLFVDPANASRVWVTGTSLVESLDAGANWRRSTAVHADQHAMAWDPLTSGRVYLGDDGGVYRSSAGGSATGAWTKSTSQAHLQFYTVAVSKQDTSRISGGLQDNGSVRSWGATNWNSILGGDGLQNLIDPTDQNKVYACSQNGSCSRSTNGGSTMTGFGATTSDRRNWLTPVVFDPSNPAIMYYGGNRLNRSTSSAQSWTVISPDLSHGPGGVDGFPFGTITTIAVARTSPATIYAGTDDGRMWITRNTGSTWTEITTGLPTRWMTRVTIDPTDANLAYVAVSGFRNGDPAAHIFRTSNGGSSWQDISGNLPDAPVNDLVLDPRDRTKLYAATDVGVFLSPDSGTTWTPPGTSLPLVPISDLEATDTGTTTLLTAATYGLGIYRLN
jgi:hypothetical protein